MEPLYGRRQQSDRFTTSPDQYTLFSKFGDFSPRFTIKRKYPDKHVVYNVDYVGRLEPNDVPRSPSYTISCRHERGIDPDGLIGPAYMPPSFGSEGRHISIHRKFTEKDSLNAAQQEAKYRFIPTDMRESPVAETGVAQYSIAALLSSRSAQQMTVQEPMSDEPPPRSARRKTLSKRIRQREERALCGPVGRPEPRVLPALPRGVMHRIQNRETADLVR
jgi:hypothetical protein